MSDPDVDAPATPEEEAAARRLAAALEGSAAGAGEALAAARLLQALGAAERPDELAARRLRNELVREAGRARRFRRERLAAAAAVVLAAGAAVLLLTRHRPVNERADLAAREAAARVAVARLLGADAASAGRLAVLADNQRDARLESLWQSRFDTVLGSLEGNAAAPSPTPGGPVS